MTIDTDWQFKAEHYERVTKEKIIEIERLKTRLMKLEHAVKFFQSGGDWGYIKALITNGAPDRQIGVGIAKRITEAQANLSKELASD